MIYCISDIHGNFDAYQRILREIGLRGEDTLYVLGDVLDRGPHGIQVLQDMMARPNVVPIVGNHELMAAYCLRFLAQEITEKSVDSFDGEKLQGLLDWFRNGGRATLDEFTTLGPKKRQEVLDYLGEFSLYEEVSAGGRRYLLLHAGLENFSPDRPLENYAPDELLFTRPDYSREYWPDRYLVTGHTPTQTIPGNPAPGRVYRANHHIAIDCGCGFGGPLATVCLDTGEEFYVSR